jgi:hypothetical protein
MSDRKNDPITRLIVENETVRLTNLSIRITWKTSAGLIALTTRLFTSAVLGIAKVSRRNRSRW